MFNIGPWTYWIGTDREGRFPDIDQVIPSTDHCKATLQLSLADSKFMLDNLHRLPNGDTHREVTLDLNGSVILRASAVGSRQAEMTLRNSSKQGTDIRICTENAKFGVTEVQRGLFPMAGSAVRLRRQIPYAIAAEMLLCGEDLPARRAYELGLVNHVVPDGQALAKAKEIAARIAANGPLAVKGILATLRETEAMPEDAAFGIEQKYGMQVMTSQDAAEGPRAFLEKRKPVFTGK